jgi:hypothetical protein
MKNQIIVPHNYKYFIRVTSFQPCTSPKKQVIAIVPTEAQEGKSPAQGPPSLYTMEPELIALATLLMKSPELYH